VIEISDSVHEATDTDVVIGEEGRLRVLLRAVEDCVELANLVGVTDFGEELLDLFSLERTLEVVLSNS